MALDEQLLNKTQGADSESNSDRNSDESNDSDSDSDSDSGSSSSFNSAERSASLREAKRNQAPSGPDGNQQTGTNDLAAQKQAKKVQLAGQAKTEEKGKAAKAIDKATALIQKPAGSCLKQAWLNIIPSWGLTLLGPNIHVFLRAIGFQKLFGPLGSEWIPEKPASVGKDLATGDYVTNKSLGMTEKMGLACLDLGCLLLIIVSIALIALILKVIDNPLKVLAAILQNLWDQYTGS